ncbi:MAG: hypothetical protein JWR14_324 [Caballeronia sp.]|jgi:hypothetical protein|nr:hypothetical protein [Caballeronia sp.]
MARGHHAAASSRLPSLVGTPARGDGVAERWAEASWGKRAQVRQGERYRIAAMRVIKDLLPSPCAGQLPGRIRHEEVARMTRIGSCAMRRRGKVCRSRSCGIRCRYAVRRAAVSKNSIQRVTKPSLTVQM